jgi:hypothetical protein
LIEEDFITETHQSEAFIIIQSFASKKEFVLYKNFNRRRIFSLMVIVHLKLQRFTLENFIFIFKNISKRRNVLQKYQVTQ